MTAAVLFGRYQLLSQGWPHCGQLRRIALTAQAVMAIDGSRKNGQKPYIRKPSGSSQTSTASQASQAGTSRGRP